MKNYFTLILCLCALHFTACKKTEETENKPITTEKVTSTDGKSVLGGNGLPNATVGNNGDFYLDKTTANLYGPKTENAWPQPFNLANNTGTTGTPGTKILSGTIAPPLSIGSIGDFYFDTVSLNFYGPKTTASWGMPISLKVQSDGAKVLILKNQVFANVVRDTAIDNRNKKYLADVIKQIQEYNNSIIVAKDDYDLNIKIIPSNYTLTQKQALINKYKSMYDNNVAIYLKELSNLDTQKFRLEKDLASGYFNLNTEIKIDVKYQDHYDNGMVMAYLRNPLSVPLYWQETMGSVLLVETKDPIQTYPNTVDCYVDKIFKDKIYLKGNSKRIEEALVKAAKFDVKIVFIPASEVITMGAAKIDTHDLKAVSKYLGVVLNK